MVNLEGLEKSVIISRKSIEDMIESAYKNFLNLRRDSATYKILLYIFWQGKIASPKEISKALNLTSSTVRDAVRQLHKMGLLDYPKRGIYEPNRDRCLAMILHAQRSLNEKFAKR
jgi:Mn-dependent DtxR family transcriptional regulator